MNKDVKEDKRNKEQAQDATIEEFFEKDLPKVDLESNSNGKIQGRIASFFSINKIRKHTILGILIILIVL